MTQLAPKVTRAVFNIRRKDNKDILDWMNTTRDPFRGYPWAIRPWRKNNVTPSFQNDGYTRQREESEQYESRRLDYDTGLPMVKATSKKT